MINKFTTHVFLIFALILMSVSPACEFISGGDGAQNFIEICAADGSVKRVALLDPMGGPLAPLKQQNPSTPNHVMQDMGDCAFCFANTTFDKNIDQSNAIVPHLYAGYMPRGAGMLVPLGMLERRHFARAPPQIVINT